MFIQPGNTITLVAPYDVAAHAGALVGSIFGVAVTTLASGQTGEFELVGVHPLTKKEGIAFSVGEKVYWNAAGKFCDEADSSGSYLIGVATVAAGNDDTTVDVRLNGTSVS